MLRRAELLVMGETLGGQGTRTVMATLDGPVGDVLVTIMRASSRVFGFAVGTQRAPAA